MFAHLFTFFIFAFPLLLLSLSAEWPGASDYEPLLALTSNVNVSIV